MGTRGCIRIIIGNKIICLYNHWDSYPSGLGFDLLSSLINLLNKYSIGELIELFDKVKIVDDSIKPTEDDIAALEEYTDLSVGNKSKNDWYCLLRVCQGSILKILECGYAYNYANCSEDGNIFIEYVYNIDLNNKKFTCKQANWDVPLSIKDLKTFLNEQRNKQE